MLEASRTLSLGTALLVIGLAAVLSRAVETGQSDQAQSFKIEDLAWISGDWETASGRMRIDEHWTRVAGNSLIGMSRTVAGGKTVFFEYLRIEARGADIYYVAHPRALLPERTSNWCGAHRAGSCFREPGARFSQACHLSQKW